MCLIYLVAPLATTLLPPVFFLQLDINCSYRHTTEYSPFLLHTSHCRRYRITSDTIIISNCCGCQRKFSLENCKKLTRPKLKLCLFHLTLPTHQIPPYPNNFIAIFSCIFFLISKDRICIAKAFPMQAGLKFVLISHFYCFI